MCTIKKYSPSMFPQPQQSSTHANMKLSYQVRAGWMTPVRFLAGGGDGIIFLFATASRPVLGTTQPSIQWVLGVLTPGVKRQGCEADSSPPSSAKVRNAWSCTSTPQYVFMAWCLDKYRDNFTWGFK
jgi:hypothetical protein